MDWLVSQYTPCASYSNGQRTCLLHQLGVGTTAIAMDGSKCLPGRRHWSKPGEPWQKWPVSAPRATAPCRPTVAGDARRPHFRKRKQDGDTLHLPKLRKTGRRQPIRLTVIPCREKRRRLLFDQSRNQAPLTALRSCAHPGQARHGSQQPVSC